MENNGKQKSSLSRENMQQKQILITDSQDLMAMQMTHNFTSAEGMESAANMVSELSAAWENRIFRRKINNLR